MKVFDSTKLNSSSRLEGELYISGASSSCLSCSIPISINLFYPALVTTATMLWSSSLVAVVAVFTGITTAQNDNDVSPPSYPSPWMRGGQGWEDAYAKAKTFVSGLTLLEKVNLTTGVGWMGESCVGNTGSIPRLEFPGLCLQDSPLGVRFGLFTLSLLVGVICAEIQSADLVSAFPSGMNVAATWSTRMMKTRGQRMASTKIYVRVPFANLM